MPLYSLTNFEIEKYYQYKTKFNGVYSRNNLSKIKDGTYIKNLDKNQYVGIHWIDFFMGAKNITYFDSFKVGYIPK